MTGLPGIDASAMMWLALVAMLACWVLTVVVVRRQHLRFAGEPLGFVLGALVVLAAWLVWGPGFLVLIGAGIWFLLWMLWFREYA